MLVDQMISCIEYIHSQFFIIRDNKPDNYLMGKISKKISYILLILGYQKDIMNQKYIYHIKLEKVLLVLQDMLQLIHILVLNNLEEMILKL